MDNKIWHPADTPPEEGDYLIFIKSDISSGGSRMMVGQITFGTGVTDSGYATRRSRRISCSGLIFRMHRRKQTC